MSADIARPRLETTATPLSAAARLRSVFGGSVGNLIERFDFYVYSAFAIYFSKNFFPGATRPPSCSTPPGSLRSAS